MCDCCVFQFQMLVILHKKAHGLKSGGVWQLIYTIACFCNGVQSDDSIVKMFRYEVQVTVSVVTSRTILRKPIIAYLIHTIKEWEDTVMQHLKISITGDIAGETKLVQ